MISIGTPVTLAVLLLSLEAAVVSDYGCVRGKKELQRAVQLFGVGVGILLFVLLNFAA